jgi:hypothetical protein
MGNIEQNLVKQAIRMGQPIPDRIKDAPDVNLGLNLYLTAFFDLDAERSHGFGYSRIPWTRMREYAEYNEFDEEQFEDLVFFIRKLDSANEERLASKKKINDSD